MAAAAPAAADSAEAFQGVPGGDWEEAELAGSGSEDEAWEEPEGGLQTFSVGEEEEPLVRRVAGPLWAEAAPS